MINEPVELVFISCLFFAQNVYKSLAFTVEIAVPANYRDAKTIVPSPPPVAIRRATKEKQAGEVRPNGELDNSKDFKCDL